MSAWHVKNQNRRHWNLHKRIPGNHERGATEHNTTWLFTIGLLSKNTGMSSMDTSLRWNCIGHNKIFFMEVIIIMAWLLSNTDMSPVVGFVISYSGLDSSNILMSRFTIIVVNIYIASLCTTNTLETTTIVSACVLNSKLDLRIRRTI